MTMFFPSTYPSSRRPCRSASIRAETAEGEAEPKNPMRGTFVGCWADAEKQSAKSTAQSVRRMTFILICFLSFLALGSLPYALWGFSSNHFVRPRQHIGRDRQTDLLRGLEIDHQLELRRLLHRQIGGLSTFQNLVDIRSGATEQVVDVYAVAHKSPVFHKFCRVVYRRELTL